MTRQFEVAVVGGGPAGAATASLLAARGRSVVVLEQAPAWRWRACGVFASPAAVAALRRIGLDDATVLTASRPVPAMRVETPGGVRFRLTYGDDGSLERPAVGFDRAALDPALLALAAAGGAVVREGAAVRSARMGQREATLQVDGSEGGTITAGVVVGADGPRSVVARTAGAIRRSPMGHRVGLTFHVPDPDEGTHDARMVVLRGAYVGLAPVPGGRINVGIVLASRAWRSRLHAEGALAVARSVLSAGAPELADATPCDRPAGAAPLAHAVSRRAGPGWLLVGDAAGFLDPFTGEGLHRALVSAELAAAAVDARLSGSSTALGAYERAMHRRFLAKDAVSLVVQAFLARPALFEYAARRLASRGRERETMGLVMGDLVPASRALDPRFLAALLRP